jgi:hypothetical protein
MPLTSPSGSNLLNELMLEWSGTNFCFYVTSGVHEGLLSELQNHNWEVIAMGNEDVIKNSGVIHISMLQELLITLATSIKKVNFSWHQLMHFSGIMHLILIIY